MISHPFPPLTNSTPLPLRSNPGSATAFIGTFFFTSFALTSMLVFRVLLSKHTDSRNIATNSRFQWRKVTISRLFFNL